MEATILFVAVASLILLAVTSMRYGVDSREAFSVEGARAGPQRNRLGWILGNEKSPAGCRGTMEAEHAEASGASKVRLCLVRSLISVGTNLLPPTCLFNPAPRPVHRTRGFS